MARIATDLAALATMSQAQLREAWERTGGGEPPGLTPDLLRRLLAYRLQAKRHGGLPATIVRELVRSGKGREQDPARRPEPAAIRPGTRLVREWQGRTITVLATDEGFVWEDRPYRSLTAIAREVTGARWSGPRFFGLTNHA